MQALTYKHVAQHPFVFWHKYYEIFILFSFILSLSLSFSYCSFLLFICFFRFSFLLDGTVKGHMKNLKGWVSFASDYSFLLYQLADTLKALPKIGY